jgi:hypothetical protein
MNTQAKPKLTTKQRGENADRKLQARKLLDAYAEIVGSYEHLKIDETILCDLLADCMHLMGREAVEVCMFWAGEHYEAERTGQE